MVGVGGQRSSQRPIRKGSTTKHGGMKEIPSLKVLRDRKQFRKNTKRTAGFQTTAETILGGGVRTSSILEDKGSAEMVEVEARGRGFTRALPKMFTFINRAGEESDKTEKKLSGRSVE